MKKLFPALALALLVSCSKSEDVTPTPQPEKPQTEQGSAPSPEQPSGGSDQPSTPGADSPTSPTEEPPGSTGSEASPRPTDYYMGLRGYASWRVTPEVYYEQFPLEMLSLEHNQAFFTAEYLSRFVDFFASMPEGQHFYRLTADDIKHMKIHDIAYDRGFITFYTGFAGVKSTVQSRLELRPEQYYARRITLDDERIASLYMRGVYERLDVFVGQLLRYDTDRYAAELVEGSQYAQDSDNKLSWRMRLTQKGTERELATVELTTSAFRSLNTLGESLMISSSYELVNKLKQYIGSRTTEAEIATRLGKTISLWMPYAQILYRGERLSWRDRILSLESGESNLLDLYLQNPSFELVSARLLERDLILTVRLANANDVTLDQVTYTFTAYGVK